MTYEEDFNARYEKLSTNQKRNFQKHFQKLIAPQASSVTREQRYRLSLYLLRKMLRACRPSLNS